MHVLDHFPNARLIEASELRQGDVIAYTPAGQADTYCVVVYDRYGRGGQKITSDGTVIGPTGNGFHLIDRPKPTPPTTPGAMIRITDSGEYRDDNVGEVLTCNTFGDFIGPRTRLGRHAIAAYGIAWERVWLHTSPPSNEDTARGQTQPLPTGPGVLIHITDGPNQGALMRRTHGSRHDFQGIMTDGAFTGMSKRDIEQHGWESVNHIRDEEFHADQPF